ncbi:MAG: hypothetical protein ACREKR_02245 [Candidatus Methylomirabilales bacterium]
MTLRQLVLLAILALGAGLLVVVPMSPVRAAEPVSIVNFDSKTRVVTVRAPASGKTYQCIVPADQDGSLLKPGVKVDLDVQALAKPSSVGSAASSCGGWGGPRDAPTKAPPPPPKKSP